MECISLRTDEGRKDHRSLASDDRSRIFIDTPSRSFPPLCMSRTDSGGEFPVRGDCLRICPIPRRPERLPERLERIRRGSD
jgi:hypothetical protein